MNDVRYHDADSGRKILAIILSTSLDVLVSASWGSIDVEPEVGGPYGFQVTQFEIILILQFRHTTEPAEACLHLKGDTQ